LLKDTKLIKKSKQLTMKLKNLIGQIAIAFGGGIFALGACYFTFKDQISNHRNVAPISAKEVSFKGYGPGAIDFTSAAERAIPCVVHITASESKKSAMQRQQQQWQNSPFGRFFGEDMMFGFPFEAQPQQGSGSGVILSRDGYIVTNNHVINFADEMEVQLNDERKFKAKLVGTDDRTDLAVLKIEGQNLPVLEYGNADQAKIGSWVLAIGNPYDLYSTVTAGIISAKGRDLGIINQGMKDQRKKAIESFIQTDAAVNPGNSGGALVDTDGKLLGINTAIYSRTGAFSGYSFAIPVDIVRKTVEDIIKFGKPNRPSLGVTVSDLDKEWARQLGVSTNAGVVIESLEDNSASLIAGLKVNDVIVSVNNSNINSGDDLNKVLSKASSGETLMMRIHRGEEILDVPVRLKTRSNQ
jgi:serine protease Do